MLIRIGYDIELAVATPMALIYLLRVHPSRRDDLLAPENVQISGGLVPEEYIDSFGNHCGRVNVPVGMPTVRITNDAVVVSHDAVHFPKLPCDGKCVGDRQVHNAD